MVGGIQPPEKSFLSRHRVDTVELELPNGTGDFPDALGSYWLCNGGVMQFCPEGCIAIPAAQQGIWEALYPGESERVVAELKATRDGPLPAAYKDACDHIDEMEMLLLEALIHGHLVAFAFDENSKKWKVPQDYWETDMARCDTLLHGTLNTRDCKSRGWVSHHGEPCFLEEVEFHRWLRNVIPPLSDAATVTGAGAFEKPYWNYMMVLAWAVLRDRSIVEEVAGSFIGGRPYHKRVAGPNGQRHWIESDYGPVTPLWLELTAQYRSGDTATNVGSPAKRVGDTEAEILTALEAGTIAASGLENGAGNRQEIAALWWADAKIFLDNNSKPYAAHRNFIRFGTTTWHDLLFARAGVLRAWPDPAAVTDAEMWLREATLELKPLFNLARGADPLDSWPPPKELMPRWRALKAAVDDGRLRAMLRGSVATKASVVALSDLLAFVNNAHGAEWEGLRGFSERWRAVRGNMDAPLEPDIARTGAAGRPTIMHLIKAEMQARAGRGELLTTLAGECRLLQEWAAKMHPGSPVPGNRAIENALRDDYKAYRAKTTK